MVGHGEGWSDRVRWILVGLAIGAVVMGAAAALVVLLVDEPSSEAALVADAALTTSSTTTTGPDHTTSTNGTGTPSGAQANQKPTGQGASQSGASGKPSGANAITPTPTPEPNPSPAPASPAQPKPQDQPQSTTLDLSSPDNGDLRFQPDKLEAPAGEVTLEYTNPSGVVHSIALESNGGDSIGEGDEVKNGKTSTVSSDLTPGTYTYYCTLPGHREAGMEGTLTVK